jgi:hypothetical protein
MCNGAVGQSELRCVCGTRVCSQSCQEQLQHKAARHRDVCQLVQSEAAAAIIDVSAALVDPNVVTKLSLGDQIQLLKLRYGMLRDDASLLAYGRRVAGCMVQPGQNVAVLARLYIASLLIKMGGDHTAKAKRYLLEASQIGGGGITRHELAHLMFGLGQCWQAEQAFGRALRFYTGALTVVDDDDALEAAIQAAIDTTLSSAHPREVALSFALTFLYGEYSLANLQRTSRTRTRL